MEKREYLIGDDGYYYTPRDLAIKWIVITSLMIGFLMFLGLSYWHAHRRMSRGKPPLKYHRWLIPRAQRAQFEPESQNQFSFYQAQNGPYDYNQSMNPQAPPPAYNPDLAPPPTYQPPTGASKVDPIQSPTYTPPPQPPAVGPSFGFQQTGVAASSEPPPPAATHSTNPFRL
ncbi:MAG: hypothetical protein M1839_001556 [Geoglossum umbratile]|nr:MAG: hypothetical protein M1839_001556 [Geoglossum umbratile]